MIGARAHGEPARAQARLHRLDRGREAPDGAVRGAGEEGLARARRQRAVHRLRRRRPRRGRRGRARSASSATAARPASPRTASSCRTAIYDDVRRSGSSARRRSSGRQRPRARDEGRPADRADARSRRCERHVADALERGGELARSAARRCGGLFYRPTVITGVTAGRRDGERGDVRPGRRHRALRDRGGGGPRGERHALRPRRVLLHARHGPRSGASRRRSSTASTASTPASSRPRSRRSAASRSRASAARARSTGSRSGSRSSTSAWAAS